MNQPERAIRSVAILGGGIVGLSAAIAFARSLRDVRIELVASPVDPAALADRMPGTLPTVRRFHAAIGLDEADLLRCGAAIHRLGTRFEGWSATGEAWFHVFGDYGFAAGSIPFHQIWLPARRAGEAMPYHAYSPAAALAEADRFVHPSSERRSLLSTFDYAFQIDADAYRGRLQAEARRLPLTRTDAILAQVERGADGRVAALRLTDGRRLEADLFIDASGPASPLLSALGGEFESWSDWFPGDRLLIGRGQERPDPPSPVERLSASAIGWRFEARLGRRTLAGLCFGSATPEEEARRTFGCEAELVALRTGRQVRPWIGNVLAIGDAAVALDPLHATNLHLAHSAILRALELLPGRDCHPLELREYNRRTDQQVSRVRDFLALHYLRPGRTQGRFWRDARRRPPAASLAHTLEQFELRGRLPFYEEETFTKESWTAALLGLGVLPAYPDAVASGVNAGGSRTAMARARAQIETLSERLPPYPAYLKRMGG